MWRARKKRAEIPIEGMFFFDIYILFIIYGKSIACCFKIM